MSFRIAIDGYRLVGPPTSVGTYTEELLDILLEEDCEVILLAPHEEASSYLNRIHDRLPAIRTIYPETVETPYESWGSLVRWNQRIIPKLLEGINVDALFSTYHQVPVRVPPEVARIAIIHDCCGLRTDCGYRQYGRAWWRHWSNLKSSAMFADALIPISQATYDSFLRLNPGSRRRLVAPIYNRVSRPVLDRDTVQPQVEACNLKPGGYLLGFAVASKRKGTDVALRAYNEYRRQGGSLPLVLMCGDELDLEAWGLSPEFASSVLRVGRVDDDLRDALYAHASCFLFFSRCEGFGYPIIEAARQGCPVVVWNHGTGAELLGESQPMMTHLEPCEGAALIRRFASLTETDRAALRERLVSQSLRFAAGNNGQGFIAAVAGAVANRSNQTR